MRKASAWAAMWMLSAGATARAEWQPAEPPPVPPETAAAERERAPNSGPALPPQTGPEAPELEAQASTTAEDSAAPPPPRASPRPSADHAMADKTGTTDALDLFPPAPPPGSPAAQLAPRDALTSFAPAPTPPPGGAVAHGTPAQSATTPATTSLPSEEPPPQDSLQTTQAVAAPTGSSEQWSAATLLGVGATFDNTIAGVNPMGFGFGVRGDYRVLPEWAVGARMLYFVGGSVELPASEVSMQTWLLAAEGAYVIELNPVTIEPGIAMGLHMRETNNRDTLVSFATEPTAVSTPDRTRVSFYVAPGLNASVPLSLAAQELAPLRIGADVRVDFAFGGRMTSNIQFLLQAGFRF